MLSGRTAHGKQCYTWRWSCRSGRPLTEQVTGGVSLRIEFHATLMPQQFMNWRAPAGAPHVFGLLFCTYYCDTTSRHFD